MWSRSYRSSMEIYHAPKASDRTAASTALIMDFGDGMECGAKIELRETDPLCLMSNMVQLSFGEIISQSFIL